MKVLMINGSPHIHGSTRRALDEVALALADSQVEVDVLTVGHRPIRGCIACGQCDGRCRAFDDEVNLALEKLEQSDALVIASPVYFASPNGTLLAFLDRMFSAGDTLAFAGKPAACVAVARRAGTSTTLDALLKYPAIKGMPLATACYWPMVHGSNSQQVTLDEEGMEVMRTLGRNLGWLLTCIEQGKRAGVDFPLPEEPHHRTDFIR